ncbi:HK97 family phage prohead protease [Paenibacillus thailandensis]|uniref:HK97 family phage prohead protease n=1 Tax=Paenibacillus thailandensis TaxID=393250 RepID=A0ABW5R409_9BACL
MKVEIRNDSIHIEGYVNAVERESRILPSPKGKFIEKVKAKTFQRALERQPNVDLLFNHDYNRKLGNTTEGNVQLWEDEIGLRAVVDINDPEIVEKAKNKQLTGWSFAFRVNKDSWTDGEDGIQRRTLEDIDLPEVSILSVTPAYIATSIEIRDEVATVIEHRNVDDIEYVVEEEVRNEPIDYSLFEYQIQINKLKNKGH